MEASDRFPGILAITLLPAIVSAAAAKYSGGSGTADDPYRIATAADLIALGETPEDYDKHFVLTADIDLDPNFPGRKVFDRAVIAPDTNDTIAGFDGAYFTGVFDGRGHTVSHLTVWGVDYLGLFGRLYSGAEVNAFGVVDVSITGSGDYVGGLAGFNRGDGRVTLGVVPALDPSGMQWAELEAGCFDTEPFYLYEVSDGPWVQERVTDRFSNDGTLYMSYDPDTDELHFSYTGYGKANAWQTVTGLLKGRWASEPVYVILGGGSEGMTLEPGDAWLDDFILTSGVLIRSEADR